MNRILDRYISKQFLSIVVFALLAFISIFIIVDLVEKLDSFINNDVPYSIILRYYLYSTPYIVVLTVPVAMLLASLFSIGNLARRNEIIVMKAAGISLYRILFPVLFIAFMVSLGSLAFSELVVPGASELKADITDNYLEADRKSYRLRINNLYMRDNLDRRISMRFYYADQKRGDRISIKTFKDGVIVQRIDARKILWSDSTWVLYDGFERIFNGEHETAIPFTEKPLPDLTLTPDDFAKTLKLAEEMSYSELKAFIKDVTLNGGDPNRWLVDLYLKISVPFASFIIVLFGAPLSSHKRRGGAMTGFGISLAICFIYFGIVKTLQTMGHNGHVSPLFAAWFGNALFAVGGIIAMIKAPK